MPEDLLLELETVSRVTGGVESIENLEREALRHAVQIGLAVEGMQGLSSIFEHIWQRIIVEVAKGQTTEIQAVRQRLVDSFEKRLHLLRHTLALASWLRTLDRVDLPDPDILLPEIAGMERLKANVFDRWQTAEDLEDLAARDYPLTTADLDQLGHQRRPPESYYAEESKPF
jgi:hypothetical protein